LIITCHVTTQQVESGLWPRSCPPCIVCVLDIFWRF